MIDRCRIAHFDDLKPHQQAQMLDVLNDTTSHETQPTFALTGGRPVALLKDEKVIAAMVTDENHKILHWAGRQDREFLEHFRHTPAMAIMRAYLQHRGKRNITFVGQASDAAINLFNRRFGQRGAYYNKKQGALKKIYISKTRFGKMKSKIPFEPNVWRLYPTYPNLHRAGFQNMAQWSDFGGIVPKAGKKGVVPIRFKLWKPVRKIVRPA